jgi:hypothetical protein
MCCTIVFIQRETQIEHAVRQDNYASVASGEQHTPPPPCTLLYSQVSARWYRALVMCFRRLVSVDFYVKLVIEQVEHW